ncbi:type II toxin-antitoxin system RelE/ParE family toxin [Nocardioides sp. NPDC057772]|uniref:type II toxin-antitoxin system RelE family toxin n=1 Tax=Nocardioides sp. NPDC057772 TaxID=3346245 RepID=UPI00366DB900
MTYQVVWADEALRSAEAYVDDDPIGLIQVFDTVDTLAETPRDVGAYAWGKDRYRLRVGRYRIVYVVEERRITVAVIHIGRRSA